ncbi:heterokaryon incompatibility protein-domain-containing protein [Podospora didyma]|uniref:Heterokaryon incompatibility protein-domain-containing protein n=1 Tax=Podospora didyma TaxID=330526 RepID=A0AAE0N1Q4_9PEZI|nr:heterokaryon incompatibility protein-domain-containing protein [Podospora didyma]
MELLLIEMSGDEEVASSSLRTVDFSSNPAVMYVSTMLRRLWLVDSSPMIAAAQHENGTEGDHQEGPVDMPAIFRGLMQQFGESIATTPPHERWDDELWKTRVDLVLLDPPATNPIDDGNDEGPEPNSSVSSRFRNEVHFVYNDIFFDVYNTLKDEVEFEIGEFKPPSTVVMAISGVAPHTFKTDTFVYPIWIRPNTSVTIFIDNIERVIITPEGHRWTSALWFAGGQIVIIVPKGEGGEIIMSKGGREESSEVDAVFAIGQCKHCPRSLPPLFPDTTIGPLRMKPRGEAGWDGKKPLPEFWPEGDHLGRAVFLKAGDAVQRCTFDDIYTRVEEEEEEAVDDDLETGVRDLNLNPELISLYSPLPGNHSIRILVIEPGPAEDDLQTRLVVVDLDDKPTFDAVSYTWGSPLDKTVLPCNGSAVPIPRNLETFLKRIRDPVRTRRVWADSVCINQEDIPERGQQVSIMRKIYGGAERVLVWLGMDENKQAQAAFKAVCDIVRFWRPEGDPFSFESYTARIEPMSADELAQIAKFVDKSAFEALRAMFEVDYFRRFWIIQELALGGSAEVFWGHHHISWGLIGVCAAWVLTSGWGFNHGGAPITAAYNAFLIYCLPLAKQSGISPFSKLALSLILGTTVGRFDSTDPRDRIYALLGVPFSGNDPDTGPFLVPDYSQSVETVYIHAAQRILQQDQNLRLLSVVQHGPELDDTSPYPSWVPQWNKANHAEPLGLIDEQGFYANGGELFFPTDETFSTDSTTLTLTGLQCGTITSASMELEKGQLPGFHRGLNSEHSAALGTIYTNLNDQDRQLRASWSATTQKFMLWGYSDPAVQAHYMASEKKLEVAIHIQPGKYGMRGSIEPISNSERAQTNHLGEFLLYWRERASWRAEDLQHWTFKAFWDSIDERGTTYIKERALCAMNTLAGRRVFTCDDGKFGLGPAAMREGDVVAILFGGVVPFVLRPVDSEEGVARDGDDDGSSTGSNEKKKWRLVGECFVPGLMQGEAVIAAGMLEEGMYDYLGDDGDEAGPLQHKPRTDIEGKDDPRFSRKVGEHGVATFRIV